MQGIYFLLSLAAFGIICMWFVQNDDLTPGKRTTGLLRVKTNDSHADDTSTVAKPATEILQKTARKRPVLKQLSSTIG